ILASENSNEPRISGIEQLAALPKTDFRIFGKPTSRPYRRMGVALTYDTPETDIKSVVERAKAAAALVKVLP
ncbi:MAG TPA: phosphoribosylglycinamide formyltransferase 2, partial [Flavobacterium sp.]